MVSLQLIGQKPNRRSYRMKTIIISGHLCIFDDDAITNNLHVHTHTSGYKALLYTTGKNKDKKYARILMNAPKDLEVDHKNGNTLDNRKKVNLRLATSQQNKFNTKGSSKRKHKLPKGVYRNRERYKAQIVHNYTTYNLGTFLTIE